jgi:hypothetical protein
MKYWRIARKNFEEKLTTSEREPNFQMEKIARVGN